MGHGKGGVLASAGEDRTMNYQGQTMDELYKLLHAMTIQSHRYAMLAILPVIKTGYLKKRNEICKACSLPYDEHYKLENSKFYMLCNGEFVFFDD